MHCSCSMNNARDAGQKKKKEVKRWTPDASRYPNGVLDPFFSISLISLTQITIIQLKNLTKTIKKKFTIVIVF